MTVVLARTPRRSSGATAFRDPIEKRAAGGGFHRSAHDLTLDKRDGRVERAKLGKVFMPRLRDKPALLGRRRRRQEGPAEMHRHDPVALAMHDQHRRLHPADDRQ